MHSHKRDLAFVLIRCLPLVVDHPASLLHLLAHDGHSPNPPLHHTSPPIDFTATSQTAMADTGEVMRTVLQYCVFLLLLVVGVTPFIMMLSRSTTCRAQMRALGCSLVCLSSCFSCFACVSRPSVHYDEHDLRTLQELEEPARPVGITGAYRMYQARRARMSLHLASWHEDVKKGDRKDELHYKLQKLHARELESRSATDALNASSYQTASNTGGVPFDIRIVEINDRVNEDTSSERSFGAAYTAMPDTPSARSDRSNVMELRLQDDEEEKEDASSSVVQIDTIHAVV